MRTILPLALLVAVVPGLPSCNDGKGLLLAKQVENRAELVGGPLAVADVGDYLLQNDQIRVNILGSKDSPGPGVYGGSIADVDIRRDRLGFEDAQGHDKFAELFPVANLLVPDPVATDVKVLNDGQDGKEASIRAEGKAAFLFEALSILRKQKDLLGLIFPQVKTEFRFRTDYILRVGDRHITIRTTLLIEEPPPDLCPDVSSCDASKCEHGFKGDPNGCVVCECGEPVALEPFFGPASVFDTIFGDNVNNQPAKNRSGMVAGDFVFFGAHADVFAPGIGFDEEKAVNQAFYEGRNTFQRPLAFDFVASAAGDVSYSYFTAGEAGGPTPVVNVPLISSSATAMLAAGKTCSFDSSDDEACDNKRAFTFERYLAVGDGDIASVTEEMYKVRGTKTGTLRGAVMSAETGEAAANAQVFVLTNPTPGKRWATLDALTDANVLAIGSEGLATVIDADVGLDKTEDGDFRGVLPPGDYVVVARSADGNSLSTPESIRIDAGSELALNFALPTAATIEYRIVDDGGLLVPAKIAVVAMDDEGRPLERDGRRRVHLGDGRLGNGVRSIEYSPWGEGSFRVEPGRYRLRASRGPEYGIFEQDVELGSGNTHLFNALLPHEVDTTGWMSTDMHIHSQASHDSGMLLADRLATIVDEHVELAIPTDHDTNTDYVPTIRALMMEPLVTTAISSETTTIEQGHFIGFPQVYNHDIVPTHGAHDPTCEGGLAILEGLRKSAAPDHEMLTIVAHPRDGFFGYIEQLGVDPFTMKRKTPSLEEKNPVFRTAGCEFDAMELLNGKRFDLVRTATVEEVVDYNRCRTRLDAAKTEAELVGVCPEISSGMLAPCKAGERYAVCQHRNRSALVWRSMKRILLRTPSEQEALWNYAGAAVDGQPMCLPATYQDAPVPEAVREQPCTIRSGHLDDYFRYLEHGMLRSQIASSDTHGHGIEPGSPRTYFQSPTDSPAHLDIDDATKSLKEAHAFGTYGPFITATVSGKTFGETAKVSAGGKGTLDLRVQTASWFGVDRIEIYQNGLLVNVTEPKSKPADIDDFRGAIPFDVPSGRDSWIVVVAMGLEDRNLMTPAYLDVPFGEIQISKVTADAFSLIPVVNTLFAPIPVLPDWYPIPAYAVTNAIYLDADGNGKYDAPLPFPEFCSKRCTAGADCPSDQSCLEEEGVCGFFIVGECDHRRPWGNLPPE